MKRNSFLSSMLLAAVLFILCGDGMAELSRNESGKVTVVSEQIGDIQFDYRQSQGVNLSIGGTSVVTSSSLFVVSPNWVEKFFLSTSESFIENVIFEDANGAKKITLIQRSTIAPSNVFEAEQVFTIYPDNRIIFHVDVVYKGDNDAIFESKIAGLNAVLFAGRDYEVYKGGQKTAGTVPVKPAGATPEESKVADNFDRIIFHSRLGDVEITSKEGDDAIIFDYRGNMWAEANDPILWFGYLNKPLEKNVRRSYTVTMKLPSVETDREKKVVSSQINVQAVADARVARWGKDYVMPTPKQLEYTSDKFPLSERTRIYLPQGSSDRVENGISFLREDIENNFGFKPVVIRGQVPDDAYNVIVIGTDLACTETSLSIPENPEGYCLNADDNKVVISSCGDQGVFNGIMTLLQLITLEDSELYIKGAAVTDYPSLDMRGLHFFSGKNAGDQSAKLVRDVMARFKLNTLVWQCDYVNWDNAGTVHKNYGMDKADAKKVVVAAKQNNVEFIPLLATLGHAEWIFDNGANMDIVEDPEKPYAYCPTNPATYDFIYGMFEEILDFCIDKPRIFHIGHDEVTMFGRFPYRSKDSGKSVTELVGEDIQKLNDWFSQRDIRIGLWGDMFLSPDEASSAAFASDAEESKKRRDMLPDDAVIFDWHYESNPPEKFTSLKVFADENFDTVGSTWSKPDNIANMAKAIKDNNLDGLLQTTWAGYSMSVDNRDNAWVQYWAYLFAAEYAWTGDNVAVSELPFCAADLFYEIWNELKPIKSDKGGMLFDLSSLYNQKLEEGNNAAGFGDSIDLSGMPTGKVLLHDTNFLINETSDGEGCIILKSNLNRGDEIPDSVKLEFEPVEASKLSVLLTSAIRVKDGDNIGTLTIGFSDGTCENIDLVYGKNIFAYNDVRVTSVSRIAWRGADSAGSEVGLGWVDIDIAQGKEMVSFNLENKPSDSSVVLVGLTAVK